MQKHINTKEENVLHVPLDMFIREGQSQRNRVVKDVMEALFSLLPADTKHQHDFMLPDKTECWIKAFHPPREESFGEWIYGFDVKLGEGNILSHLEFSVRCCGWERALPAPDTQPDTQEE